MKQGGHSVLSLELLSVFQ